MISTPRLSLPLAWLVPLVLVISGFFIPRHA